ncbi:MAG: hypothetical protein AAF519_12780 [Bacteroidota bacterium]
MHLALATLLFCTFQICSCSGQNPSADKLPFGIKPYQDDPEILELIKEMNLIGKANFLSSSTPESIKKLFRHRKDGIVQEVVLKGQVDCDSKVYYSALNRRNGNSSTNGRIYQPFYKKDLIKEENFKLSRVEFERQKAKDLRSNKRLLTKTKRQLKGVKAARKRSNNVKSRSAFQKKIDAYKIVKSLLTDGRKQLRRESWKPFFWSFNIPESAYFTSNEAAEINLLVLRKNRIVYPFYHKKNRQSSIFKDSVSIPEWKNDSSSIVIQPEYKELVTEVYFDRNVTSITSKSFDAFKAKVENHLIDSISLMAFASVEGTLELNQKLFEKRAENLYMSLAEYRAPHVVFSRKMSENWPLFYTQIKDDTLFSSWTAFSQDSIRALLKKYRDQSPWNEYLKEQRKSKIRVVMHKPIDTLKYLRKRFDFKNLDDLTEVQNYMISAARNGRLNPQYVFDLQLNKDSTAFSPLILNRYLLEYELGRDTKKFDYGNYSRRFFKNINVRKANTNLLSTYLTILVKYWEACSPSVPANFQIFSELQSRGLSTRAMAIFALKAIQHYKPYFTRSKVKYYPKYVFAEGYLSRLPNYVYDFYVEDSTFMLRPENYRSLARMFLEHRQDPLANNLLDSYQQINGPNKTMKSLQLRINYLHPSQDDRQYVKELIYQHSQMNRAKWCSLFDGENAISFQSFDDPELRTLYCVSCSD